MSKEFHPRLLTDPAQVRKFALAGNAYLTLKSKSSGSHFTFSVRAPKLKEGETDNGFRFVKVLSGADKNYLYFGFVKPAVAGALDGAQVFKHGGQKAKVAPDARSAAAFAWAWQAIENGSIPKTLEVWHEGRCGRCGIRLTHPESIESGFGPECIKHFEAVAA
jgi:hypothetical protein